MRRLLFIVLLASACTKPVETVPTDVLPKDRFTEVLLECYLIEARTDQDLASGRISTMPPTRGHSDLFERLAISKEEFSRSFTYWSERPAEFKEIHERILIELGRRKDAVAQ